MAGTTNLMKIFFALVLISGQLKDFRNVVRKVGLRDFKELTGQDTDRRIRIGENPLRNLFLICYR